MIEEKPIAWREMLETIFRRRWLIATVTALGMVAAGVVAALTPKQYRATARILLTAQALSGPRQTAMSDRQVQAEISLLTSRSLTRSLIEEYRAKGKPREPVRFPIKDGLRTISTTIGNLFDSQADAQVQAPAPGDPVAGSPVGRNPVAGDAVGRDRSVSSGPAAKTAEQSPPSAPPPPASGRLLWGKLKAASIKHTNVIAVSYTGYDQRWSANFVNDLLKHHISKIVELNEKASAGSFFQEQRNLLAVRWQETREALSSFQREQGASLLAGDDQYLRSVLSRFEASLAETETKRLELTAMSRFLKEEIVLMPEKITTESRITENEAVGYLHSLILDLEIERSEALSRYRPTSVRVRALDQQIQQARNLLESKQTETLAEYMTEENPVRRDLKVQQLQIETEQRGTAAKELALHDQIASYRERLHLLERLGTELERLTDDVTNAKQAYQVYSKKEEEARLSSSLDHSGIVNVSIIEPAEMPKRSVPSKAKLFLILGCAIGFVLGFILAFLKDWLDPVLKSSAQAYRLSGIPIISEIPSS